MLSSVFFVNEKKKMNTSSWLHVTGLSLAIQNKSFLFTHLNLPYNKAKHKVMMIDCARLVNLRATGKVILCWLF